MTPQAHQELRDKSSPNTLERIDQGEKLLREDWTKKNPGRSGVYKIPVVFHVIHDGGPEKISISRVDSAIDILNRDFRKNNADTSDIVAPYDNIAADVEVEFRRAQKDPKGNCHIGVNYIKDNATYNGDDQAAVKGTVQWDPSMYLNIWVVNEIGGGTGGYAIRPVYADQYPSYDGIVVIYDVLGEVPPSYPPVARALTHEVGHYLGLLHPWGDQNNGAQGPGDPTNCNYDDGIPDTDTTVGWTSCDLNGSSCGGPDNVQNYMEYSFCHRMFTDDQRTAMRNVLNSSVADRDQLWAQSNLVATGTHTDQSLLCSLKVHTEPRMVCAGGTVEFQDSSFHAPSSWTWSFPGGSPSSSSSPNTQVSYSDTGTYDVSLTVSNSTNTIDTSFTDHIKVIPDTGRPLPFIEDFEADLPLSDRKEFSTINKDQDQIGWTRTDQAGEGGSNGSIRLRNQETDKKGYVDIFETTTMDASSLPNGALELSFDVAYVRKNASNDDELKVYVSTTCGNYWDLRKTFSAQQLESADSTNIPFTPQEGDWKNLVLNSSLGGTYNIPGLRFRFEFVSGGGNNIFIDNINVYDENKVGTEDRTRPLQDLKIRPNPVKDVVRVEYRSASEQMTELGLRDMQGRELIRKEKKHASHREVQQETIDVSELEAGAYILVLRTEKGIVTKKLFVE